jgi:hypothetical protein
MVPIAVLVLRLWGRIWWCKCGSFNPISGEAHGTHTSQHLLDPYSFTHALHGVLFYGLLWLALGRFMNARSRLPFAVFMEACWELIENSAFVIERYRAQTAALEYTGDSIVNSLGDIACCTFGFVLAWKLPVRVSVALFVMVELLLLAVIRDNLTLNVLMLTFPLESVKQWQGH